MPRLNKADTELVEHFGFDFATPPEVDGTRTSKYDPMWEAARNLCKKFPGQSLKVRTHNNPSSAYEDAKKVNNGEKRLFKEDFKEWKAVAAPSNDEDEVYPLDYSDPRLAGKRMTAVYLTYIGEGEANAE